MMTRYKATAELLTACLVVFAWGKADDSTTRPVSSDQLARKYFERFDKNKNGSLARGEIPAAWRDEFEELDNNNDGKLSFEELRPHIIRLVMIPVPVEIVSVYTIEAANCNPTLQELQDAYEMLRKCDANKDGKISEDEAHAARDHAIAKRIDAIFKRCDTNDNGEISKDECQGSLTAAIFKKADKNNDGFVIKEELRTCFQSQANKAVNNGSGINQ